MAQLMHVLAKQHAIAGQMLHVGFKIRVWAYGTGTDNMHSALTHTTLAGKWRYLVVLGFSRLLHYQSCEVVVSLFPVPSGSLRQC